MISKIGMTPSFTSKVNFIYNNNYSVIHFYDSEKMRNQIIELQNNNHHDTVNLIPVECRNYGDKPHMRVQVLEKQPYGDVYYSETIAKEPEDLLTAYKEARKLLFPPAKIKHIRPEARETMSLFV